MSEILGDACWPAPAVQFLKAFSCPVCHSLPLAFLVMRLGGSSLAQIYSQRAKGEPTLKSQLFPSAWYNLFDLSSNLKANYNNYTSTSKGYNLISSSLVTILH